MFLSYLASQTKCSHNDFIRQALLLFPFHKWDLPKGSSDLPKVTQLVEAGLKPGQSGRGMCALYRSGSDTCNLQWWRKCLPLPSLIWRDSCSMLWHLPQCVVAACLRAGSDLPSSILWFGAGIRICEFWYCLQDRWFCQKMALFTLLCAVS